MKEIGHLKTLNKLIILDLTGNQIFRQDSYRSFVIFNLKKLKVLDSIVVENNESSTAKEL